MDLKNNKNIIIKKGYKGGSVVIMSTKQYTSLENKEVEPVELLQMNIYQNNTYRKDLSWLHFDDVPRVQERHEGPTVLRICFCSLSNNSK